MNSLDNLNTYEKSFMFVSLLFARKKLDEILQYLPENSQKNIENASKNFLSLPQKDRVTKIIFELKKLFFLDEENYSLIKNEEINKALEQEPKYLQEILKKIILNQEDKDFKYFKLIKQSFYEQFI